MHRGRGRDNSAAEEWAQRKGIEINRYPAGGPELSSSPRPDQGSHEPHAGQCWRSFPGQPGARNTLLLSFSQLLQNQISPSPFSGTVLCLFSLCRLFPNTQWRNLGCWWWECTLASRSQRNTCDCVYVTAVCREAATILASSLFHDLPFCWIFVVSVLKSDFQVPFPIFYWKTKVMRKLHKHNSSLPHMKVKWCRMPSVKVKLLYFFGSIWRLNSEPVCAQTKFSFYYRKPVIAWHHRWLK